MCACFCPSRASVAPAEPWNLKQLLSQFSFFFDFSPKINGAIWEKSKISVAYHRHQLIFPFGLLIGAPVFPTFACSQRHGGPFKSKTDTNTAAVSSSEGRRIPLED